jgi:hypothetical protein
MNFFAPAAAVLLLLLLLTGAGCTGLSGDLPAIVPIPYGELSDIALAKEEVPLPSLAFMVEAKPDPDNSPFFSAFGATRAFSRQFSGGVIGGTDYVQLSQVIVEFPPGNATRAFAALKQASTRTAAGEEPPVLWQDPGIGDESIGVTLPGHAVFTKGGSTAMIVFRKSDILESVSLESVSPDTDALARAARNAAAKIP